MAALAVQLGYQCTGAEIRKRLDDMKDPTQYGVFVAVLSRGEVVGWIGVYVFRAAELDTFAEISGLVVDETLRSRGIGKALLQVAEDWARRAGCGVISVNSNVIRDRAHRFYVSNGYQMVKTQKIFRKSL
jgi:GNAT superfamily N-acetyltransferase